MNKQPTWRRAVTWTTAAATILWTLNLAFLISVPSAQAVSGVTLVDSDSTGVGIDGRDFSISWTPGTAPAGYLTTLVYLTSEAIADGLTAGEEPNVNTNGCSGGPCIPVMTYSNHADSSFPLPQYQITDSANAAFAAVSYKACVVTIATSSTIACSAAYTPTSDSAGEDTTGPTIMHMSAYSFATGGELIVYANIVDEVPAESLTTKMYFDGTTLNAVTDSVDGVRQGSTDLFKFSSGTSLSRTMKYYLYASDGTNVRYFTSNPDTDCAAGTGAVQAAAAAFSVSAVATGSSSITGTVTYTPGPLEAAYVYLDGYGVAGTTTAANGTYTLASIPNGTYDLNVVYPHLMPVSRRVTINGANQTVSALLATSGDMGFASSCGGGGGNDGPMVGPTIPYQGDTRAPLTDDIVVGFSQALNPGTVNDGDATGASDKIYLTTDDGTTKIAGSVTWCATSSGTGCSSLGDITNAVVFNPNASLTAGTQYTLVITSGVVSNTTGLAIQGNRGNGNFELNFGASSANFSNFANDIGGNFGTGGEYMPPYVISSTPAAGANTLPNRKLLVVFNEAMDTSTLTTSNILLTKDSAVQTTLSISSDRTTVTITPSTTLTAGNYSIDILAAVASGRGVPMRNTTTYEGETAFSVDFTVTGSNDATAPSIFPMISNDATGVAVNEILEYGFSEQIDPATVTGTNIKLKRGSSTVTATIKYEPGENSVFIIPNQVLAPGVKYTTQFGTGVTDLAGVPIAATTYTFTTGSVDSTAPAIREARCDDSRCTIFFDEPMNHDAKTAGVTSWATSVMNLEADTNVWTITRLPSTILNIDGKQASYNVSDRSVTIEGVAGLAAGDNYRVAVTTAKNVTDLSGNNIGAGAARQYDGYVEDSATTYGNFGGGGMYPPPQQGMFAMEGGSAFGGAAGGHMDMGSTGGFGNFTADDFSFGGAVQAFPFSSTAGQDVNVFQVRIPGSQLGANAIQNDDQFQLTFPNGMTIASTVPDTYSPFYSDFNERGAGTVTFDTAYGGDGIAVDAAARTVTVQLAVSGGTPTTNDFFTIDLRKITNPNVPKDPSSGGYTIGVKHIRAGAVLTNLTAMPFYIMEGGSNSITVNIFAGSQVSPTDVGGSIYVFGGGPAGPMDRDVTLASGIISQVDGSVASSIVYSSLPDGCYFVGTEPVVTLGGTDYFGKDRPEQICVNSGAPNATQNIVLTSSAAEGASVPVNIAISGTYTGDLDVFAGGPGRFVRKTISSPTSTATLQLPASGMWHVGIGPAMSKTGGKADMDTFGAVPPPPIQLDVNVSGASVSAGGFISPQNVTFNNSTDTVTFTLQTNNITIPVSVTDGTNALAAIDVFAHAQGFGMPSNCRTNALGTCTLRVAAYGSYEIGAFKPGVGETSKQADVQSGGITVAGATVATVPMKLSKPSYSISGKVLDATTNGNAVAYTSIWGRESTTGQVVRGMTESDGSYTLWVDAGTWVITASLPPDKTTTCGTFTKTVTITTASSASQNITPTSSTCYTLSGTVTIGGSTQSSTPVFVEEWDTVNDQPAGGFFRQAMTNSSGLYTVSMGNGTYRVNTFHPDYGEITTTATVNGANNTTAHLNSGTLGTITIAFTGGSASMKGFYDLKKSNDRFTGSSKTFSDTVNNLTASVPEGTYNYFVDIPGVGKYNGSVATGSTVTIDLSDKSLITLSGTIYDSGDTALTNAVVSVDSDTLNIHRTVKTGTGGTYSINVGPGTYTVGVARSGYVPGQAAQTAVLAANTADYDFGGANPDQSALTASSKTITGTVYESNGTTPMTNAAVSAENSVGQVVSTTVDPVTGAYTLSVTSGVWTITAAGPRHNATDYSATVDTSDGTADTGKNITLTASSTTKQPKTKSKVMDAGGAASFDDSGNSDIKVTAQSGVLNTTGNNVEVALTKDYTAPKDEFFAALEGITYTVLATDIDSNGNTTTIRELSGNAQTSVVYDPTTLPSGVTESELQLMYVDPDTGKIRPCEGGVSIDTENNTVTGLTDHFTSFVVAYSRASVSSGSAVAGGAVDPVSGLTAEATSSAVTLSWTDPTSAGYTLVEILRNLPPSTAVSGTSIGTILKGVQTFVDNTVSALTQYTYIVRSKDNAGNTRNSDAVAVTTPAAGAAPTAGAPSSTPVDAPADSTTTTTTTTTLPANVVAGDRVKSSTSTAMYLVGADGKRYVYPNEVTYKSWFADFTGTKSISDAELAALPLGGIVTIRPGTWLVKIESDPKVYAVEPGGALRWVETEARAIALYGSTWNKQITDVPVSFWVAYTSGAPLGLNVHPSGTLVKTNGNTYYVENGMKRLVTADVFTAQHFQDRWVRTPASVGYTDGDALTSGTMLRFASN
ncbi:MAG: Ig-like domain-containing protein [Candidatus Uhrbacteria bacterium]